MNCVNNVYWMFYICIQSHIEEGGERGVGVCLLFKRPISSVLMVWIKRKALKRGRIPLPQCNYYTYVERPVNIIYTQFFFCLYSHHFALKWHPMT